LAVRVARATVKREFGPDTLSAPHTLLGRWRIGAEIAQAYGTLSETLNV
jgi:hypothetical protein